MIDQIQNEVEDATGKIPSEDQIWKAIQHKDFSRNLRYFLWMATHNAYRIGEYWLKEIFCEELQNRCDCTHCSSPGQKEVWELAKQMRAQKSLEWRQPWIGNIISCALTEFKNNDGKSPPGANRLWRILISKSAHLIWKLCCERPQIWEKKSSN
ncbi:hypothetical protein L208DRAFT_1410646 [Tricholoma matsutake]|nr:hypothetical protein L208DRAFT_1410646 [Tricholoma matsutake 945]